MKRESRRFVLTCAFNETFSVPAAVALRSASVHWTESTPMDVYIIDSGISETSRTRIEQSIVASRMRLHWRTIDVDRFGDLPFFFHAKPQVYHRLAIDEVVPNEVERVVWMDSDMLVCRCMAELWQMNLEGKSLAAVQDMAIPFVSSPLGLNEYKELKLAADAPYFNAGLLVIDLKRWRKYKSGSRLLQYVRDHADTVFLFDQQAFNALYAGDWVPLDPRWNVIASLAGRTFYRTTHLSKEMKHLIADSPWIVHFAGSFKPWKLQRHSLFFDGYRKVLEQTPFPELSVHWPGRLLSLYDNYLRSLLYPLERLYWIARYRYLRR